MSARIQRLGEHYVAIGDNVDPWRKSLSTDFRELRMVRIFFKYIRFGFTHKMLHKAAIKLLRGGFTSKPSLSEDFNEARPISHMV